MPSATFSPMEEWRMILSAWTELISTWKSNNTSAPCPFRDRTRTRWTTIHVTALLHQAINMHIRTQAYTMLPTWIPSKVRLTIEMPARTNWNRQTSPDTTREPFYLDFQNSVPQGRAPGPKVTEMKSLNICVRAFIGRCACSSKR